VVGEEVEERGLVVDLKRHTQLAVVWNRHGSLVPSVIFNSNKQYILSNKLAASLSLKGHYYESGKRPLSGFQSLLQAL